TEQLRVGSSAVREFLSALGVTTDHSPAKRVPQAIFLAPTEIQAAYLRGLYGADGFLSRVEHGKANRYVGLGSSSEALLKDVQRVLSSFGVRGRIYKTKNAGVAFTYTRIDGTFVEYESGPTYDLRITGSDIERFAGHIGFTSIRKASALTQLIAATSRYKTKAATTLKSREIDGQAVVYNLNEPINHSYIVDGFLVANCS